MGPNDIELVALAKVAQNDTAFAELVRRHQARLRAFLRRLCGSEFLADDIAQDTFIKAHAAIASFEGGGSFRSWLYAIAYREFLQTRRKEKAATRLKDALKDDVVHANAAETKIEMGLSLDLRRALATLEDLERAALLLCDAAGLSHSEAAIAIDAPLGSVKTYVARARQKMRAALSADAATSNADCSATPAPNGACHAL
ncbi:MAG: RNA polymerase sigma factor [Pseudomonadota bacterium]